MSINATTAPAVTVRVQLVRRVTWRDTLWQNDHPSMTWYPSDEEWAQWVALEAIRPARHTVRIEAVDFVYEEA